MPEYLFNIIVISLSILTLTLFFLLHGSIRNARLYKEKYEELFELNRELVNSQFEIIEQACKTQIELLKEIKELKEGKNG